MKNIVSQINLTVNLLVWVFSLKIQSKLKSVAGFLIYYAAGNPYLTKFFFFWEGGECQITFLNLQYLKIKIIFAVLKVSFKCMYCVLFEGQKKFFWKKN